MTSEAVVGRVFVRSGLVNRGANLVGAVLVFTYLRFVLPAPPIPHAQRWLLVNLIAFVVFVPITVVIASRVNRRYVESLVPWIASGAPAGPLQRRALRYNGFAVRVNAAIWGFSALLFAALNAVASWQLARNVGLTIAYAGLATCAVAYLVGERTLRPLAAAALSQGLPDRDTGPGVRPRVLMSWIVGALLPLAGVVLALVFSPESLPVRTEVSALFIAAVGIVVGLVTVDVVAASVADPVSGLRRAVARVADGELEGSVEVDDGSELGRLQAGFNTMLGGLRERERLRDLFGRQVGSEVAELALSRGVELGGERRSVGVLFVDVIGSTALAVAREPEEVVRRLNDFFAVVIATVDAYGGSVNKFEGDAALCVFGAPTDLPDPATAALAAGRDLAARLVESIELRAAVGVSYGSVVAGNVGAESRYEYTVIGDAVNESARLSDRAKRSGLLVASGSAMDAATSDERGRWLGAGEETVRGRDTPTRLYVPAG